MEKAEFFVKKGELIDINVEGLVFKFRKITADDALNWLEECKEKTKGKDEEGNEKIETKINMVKFAKTKLRNIMEVPFSREELKEIAGIDKDFKDYESADKDALFSQLNPKIMNRLFNFIDETSSNQKKN
jgi:hypothetical protein